MQYEHGVWSTSWAIFQIAQLADQTRHVRTTCSFGQVWFGFGDLFWAGSGQEWPRKQKFLTLPGLGGQTWSKLIIFDQIWSELIKFGQIRPGPDWTFYVLGDFWPLLAIKRGNFLKFLNFINFWEGSGASLWDWGGCWPGEAVFAAFEVPLERRPGLVNPSGLY